MSESHCLRRYKCNRLQNTENHFQHQMMHTWVPSHITTCCRATYTHGGLLLFWTPDRDCGEIATKTHGAQCPVDCQGYTTVHTHHNQHCLPISNTHCIGRWSCSHHTGWRLLTPPCPPHPCGGAVVLLDGGQGHMGISTPDLLHRAAH